MIRTTPSENSHTHSRLARILQRFRDLSVGSKLNIGFGSLVVWITFLVFLSYSASAVAKSDFERTRDHHLPSALTAATLELELYEMIGNIQGYLAQGELTYRDDFYHDVEEVEELLNELEEQSRNWTDSQDIGRLQELHTKVRDWVSLTGQILALRDDPMANQPAVRIMLREARPAEADVLTNVTDLIEQQAEQEPTAENMRLLKTMADFRSSFNLMTTAVDGYLASVDPASKALYYDTLDQNTTFIQGLNLDKELLTPDQQESLRALAEARKSFLLLPEQMFEATAGERAREDQYLMRTEATPLADEILASLDELRAGQTAALSHDVEAGTERLTVAQKQTAIGAIISATLAIVLAVAIQRDIAGPVLRLTKTTDRIMDGDLEARARVESRDEIGKLATSLNAMTDRMIDSLAEAERRAQIIGISSRVSRRLSTILDQQELVKEVVEQVQAAFDYYYVHVFLVDEDGKHLVTAGGVGDAGRELVRRGFKLSMDQGLVGRTAKTNSPVLIADVSQDNNYLPNSLLPDTKSELAVPIAIGDEVLGVLDVQHNVLAGLSKADLDMLQAIASQVAVALVNARSYADSKRRADHEALINEISQKISNTTTVEKAMQVAVREVGRAVRAERATVHLTASSPPASGRTRKEQT